MHVLAHEEIFLVRAVENGCSKVCHGRLATFMERSCELVHIWRHRLTVIAVFHYEHNEPVRDFSSIRIFHDTLSAVHACLWINHLLHHEVNVGSHRMVNVVLHPILLFQTWHVNVLRVEMLHSLLTRLLSSNFAIDETSCDCERKTRQL